MLELYFLDGDSQNGTSSAAATGGMEADGGVINSIRNVLSILISILSIKCWTNTMFRL